MKKHDRIRKTRLLDCINSIETGAPVTGMAFENQRLLHELQVHQVELESQNRELIDAQLLLEGSRDRYADLYDFAPVGYVTFNDKGIIHEANLTAAQMLGVERARLVGLPFHVHLPDEDRVILRAHLHKLLSREGGVTSELRLCRGEGAVVPVMMQSVLFYDRPKKTYLCRTTLTDITVRKREERRQQLQLETARLLAAAGSVEETVPKLLQAVADAFEWEVGEFWENKGEPNELRILHVWHAPKRKIAAFVKQSLALSFSMSDGLPSRVLASCQPQWIADISQCSGFVRREAAAKAGLRSAIAFPIQLDSRALGVMAFLTQRATEPDHDLLAVLMALGSQIGLFMDRKETEEALRRANEFGNQIISGAQAGIIVLDREARIVGWNPFMERITDYRAGEVLGRRTTEAWPFLRERQFAKMFERALDGEIIEPSDIPFDLPEKGKRIWTATRITPWRDARERIVGVIIVVRDITDRRRLEAELLETSDRERQRIGRDLHDGLGQQLTAIELMCQSLREGLAGTAPGLEKQAARMGKALREAVAQTRALSRGLSPVVCHAAGLMEALQELAQAVSATGKVACRFRCPVSVQVSENAVASQLYRIAQEAVNNAIKHGKATRIVIELSQRRAGVRFQITDNGKGLSKSTKAANEIGMGLEVMRHRASIVDGILSIASPPGKGVTVRLTLPSGKR